MSMTDPIADMLTRIRNAIQASHDELTIPSSRMKCEISKILKGEGFIDDFDVEEDEKQGKLRIRLRYGPEGERVITGIERVSRPARVRRIARDPGRPRRNGNHDLVDVERRRRRQNGSPAQRGRRVALQRVVRARRCRA